MLSQTAAALLVVTVTLTTAQMAAAEPAVRHVDHQPRFRRTVLSTDPVGFIYRIVQRHHQLRGRRRGWPCRAARQLHPSLVRRPAQR